MSQSSFMFNHLGRISNDDNDKSQRNIYNTRFVDYTLSEYFSDNSRDHVQFATQSPTMMFGQPYVPSSVIDDNTELLHSKHIRSAAKLNLEPRPFLTVPYIGRGSADPTIESKLQQGESSNDRKSVSTIMEKSFSQYTSYPYEVEIPDIQEYALDGWVRGGANTRNTPAPKHA